MPETQLHAGTGILQEYFDATGQHSGVQLQVANHLWGQSDENFLPEFLKVVDAHYGAELSRADFAGNTENARQTINDWVAQKTTQRITDIIPPGVLSTDTVLVLTNATYFKGDWAKKFDKRETDFRKFLVAPNKPVDVTMMNQIEQFRYLHDDGLQLLELPYLDDSLVMLVLLPDAVDGLPELEAKFNSENLDAWMSKLHPTEVNVSLPKFRTTSQFDLKQALTAMGMPSAFNPATADFSRMAAERKLFISAVLYKAFVDVNEEGTEAAAATAVEAKSEKGALAIRFRADHPFIYLIRDRESGVILFLGRMVNPPPG